MIGYAAKVIRERYKCVRCTVVGPENGQWRGVINLHDERGRFASRLWLSDQEYPSKQEAIDAMNYIVKCISTCRKC
jgi:hypothetical protein